MLYYEMFGQTAFAPPPTHNTQNMNHTPHDSFFGETFSIQAIALESIQMVLPASVLEELDLDNMKLEESKFQADDKNLIADVIWSIPIKNAFLKEGQKEVVDVVIFYEHKSSKPQQAIPQLLRYMVQYWDRQEKQGKPFSLIIPIVLYMGKSRWKPKQFHEMFPNVPEVLKPYLLHFKTEVLHTRDLKNEVIKQISNPLTQIVYSLYKNALADKKALETETLALIKSLFKEEAIYHKHEKGIAIAIRYLLKVTEQPMTSIQEELSATPLNKPLMSTIEQYLAQETKDLRREVEKERRQKEEAQRKQEEAQRKQEEAQRNSVKVLLEFNVPKQQIAKKLNLPLKEVERIVYELGL